MDVSDRVWDMPRAANDALRSLAIFTGLITSESLTVHRKRRGIPCLGHLPSPTTRHRFTARITTTQDGMLPRKFDTPESLAELFGEFEPKAVALNSAGFKKNNGVRWWMSLLSEDSLNDFTAQIDRASLNGEKLVVESKMLTSHTWRSV